MIAYNRNMRQLLYRKRKGLSTAKNRITSQEHDWPSELYVTLRFEVPSLEGRKVIFAWANLRLPVEGDPLAVAKAIDDRDLLVAFSHLQFSQIRGRQPYSIVRNIPYVILQGWVNDTHSMGTGDMGDCLSPRYARL